MQIGILDLEEDDIWDVEVLDLPYSSVRRVIERVFLPFS